MSLVVLESEIHSCILPVSVTRERTHKLGKQRPCTHEFTLRLGEHTRISVEGRWVGMFFLLWSQIHKLVTSGRWNSPRVWLPGLVVCPHLWSRCEMIMRYVCMWWLGVGSAVTASAPARRRKGRGRGRARKTREASEIVPQPAPNKVTCGKPTWPSSLSLFLSFRLSFQHSF